MNKNLMIYAKVIIISCIKFIFWACLLSGIEYAFNVEWLSQSKWLIASLLVIVFEFFKVTFSFSIVKK